MMEQHNHNMLYIFNTLFHRLFISYAHVNCGVCNTCCGVCNEHVHPILVTTIERQTAKLPKHKWRSQLTEVYQLAHHKEVGLNRKRR